MNDTSTEQNQGKSLYQTQLTSCPHASFIPAVLVSKAWYLQEITGVSPKSLSGKYFIFPLPIKLRAGGTAATRLWGRGQACLSACTQHSASGKWSSKAVRPTETDHQGVVVPMVGIKAITSFTHYSKHSGVKLPAQLLVLSTPRLGWKGPPSTLPPNPTPCHEPVNPPSSSCPGPNPWPWASRDGAPMALSSTARSSPPSDGRVSSSHPTYISPFFGLKPFSLILPLSDPVKSWSLFFS